MAQVYIGSGEADSKGRLLLIGFKVGVLEGEPACQSALSGT